MGIPFVYLRTRRDELFCPFQCELYLFRNIQKRSPLFGEGKLNDVVVLRSLRRANMDACWSLKPNTVVHSLSKVNHILQLGFELGMDNPPLPLAEHWLVKDNVNGGGGGIIRYSLEPVKTEETVQLKTVRKVESAMVNIARASAGFYGKSDVGGVGAKSIQLLRNVFSMIYLTISCVELTIEGNSMCNRI
jgi:hypothetical protein